MKVLKGIGTSRGIARGKVRIINSGDASASIEKGDILVTRITDPTMVSLMARAGAIVCEVGSMTSHPSVVSREMGTPCVVSVKNATTILKEGQIVSVDGMDGTVSILENDASGSGVKENISGVVDVNRNSTITKEYKIPHDRIEAFLSANVTGVTDMDFSTFEASIGWHAYDPLFAKSWIRRTLKMIDDCKNKNLLPKEIALLFPTFSELRANIIFDLWSAACAACDSKEKMEIFDFYADALEAVTLEDPFAKAKNVMHSQNEIDAMQLELLPATQGIAHLLGRLVSACYHLSHALYSDMHPAITYDNYLPYLPSGEKDKMFVIKEFKNLNAPDLWQSFDLLPVEKIKICALYNGVWATIDSTSHVIYDGDAVRGLEAYSLLVDGEPYDIHKVEELTRQIENRASEVFNKWKKFDFEKKKSFYVYQRAYAFKDIFTALGKDWRPAEDILEEVKEKPLHEFNLPNDEEEKKKVVRYFLDPRV